MNGCHGTKYPIKLSCVGRYVVLFGVGCPCVVFFVGVRVFLGLGFGLLLGVSGAD